VVTICTTILTFTMPRSAHSVFMCFVWISEQTAIISLYSINWLVFITETACVYCAVRTGSLNVTQVNVRLKRMTLVGVPARNRNVAPRECYRLNKPGGSCWTATQNAVGTSVDLKNFRTEARTGLQSSVDLRGDWRTIQYTYSTFCVVVVGGHSGWLAAVPLEFA
jgi:hypothetical protein